MWREMPFRETLAEVWKRAWRAGRNTEEAMAVPREMGEGLRGRWRGV